MRVRVWFAAALAAYILVATAHDAAAGAWVRKKAGYYFKTSGAYLFATDEYDHNGNVVDIFSNLLLVDNTSFRDVGVSAYFEYGITDRLTLVGSLPFKVLSSERRELANENTPVRRLELVNGGLSDLWMSLRYPLVRGPLILSLQGGAKLPLFYDPSPPNEGSPLGSAKVDVEGRVLVGKSLYPFPGYLGVEAGYRLRGGNLDDEILLGAEGGVTLGRVFTKVGVDALFSTVDPRDLTVSADDGRSVLVANQDIVKLNPVVGYSITAGLTVTAEIFHVLSGKNTVKGTTYSVGLVFERL